MASLGSADIVVLTVIPAELAAARAALGLAEKSRRKDEQGTVFYCGRVRSRFAWRGYRVALVCIGRAGNASSASAAAEVIKGLEPKAVLLMGIAAGLRGKVKIGEVVISERVVATEPAALVRGADGSTKKQPRPEIRTTQHRMHQDVVSYMADVAPLDARFEKAGWIFPEAPAGKEAVFAVDLALGIAYAYQPDFEKSLKHSRHALATVEGSGTSREATLLNNIGSVLQDQGELAGALVQFRRALAILENKLGKDHPNARVVRRNLAGTLAQQNGWDPKDSKGGVVVVRCVRDTCSGLTTGDWLISYGTTKLRDGKHLQELVHKSSSANRVKLSLVREGKPLTLTVPGGLLGIELLSSRRDRCRQI